MDVSERIKYLRKDILHLTQQEFADNLKVSRSNLGNIETDRVNVTERVLSDICRVFNVNIEWLVEGTGDIFAKKDLVQFVLDLKTNKNPRVGRFVDALVSLSDSEIEALLDAIEILKRMDI